ncbi:MAG: A/G-specific adenine glycosylase [Candidatus Margulisiibacteriota bacterium]
MSPNPTDSWILALTQWYEANARQLPWRARGSALANPYHVWLSEMMLQQTQVDTVIPYFNRFIAQFPTVFDLAKADQETVLKAWEGLGYYSRARNLHKAAILIAGEQNGQLPPDYLALQTLPGIGPYAAAAIASIAFEEPVPVVDGNVFRVFTRFWGIYDDIKLPTTKTLLFNRLKPAVEQAKPSVFNQAMMEVGALICKPKNPLCEQCPLQPNCYAAAHQATQTLPVKTPLPKTPHHHIGVGVLWHDGKLLISKRKESQMLGGLWEFPGGKQEENESIAETIVREFKEETDLTIAVGQPVAVVKHAYTHFKITLHAFHCSLVSGTPKALSSDGLRWILPEELKTLPFPKANQRVIEALLNETTDLPLFSISRDGKPQ